MTDFTPLPPNRQFASWVARMVFPSSDYLILIRDTSYAPIRSRPSFSVTSLLFLSVLLGASENLVVCPNIFCLVVAWSRPRTTTPLTSNTFFFFPRLGYGSNTASIPRDFNQPRSRCVPRFRGNLQWQKGNSPIYRVPTSPTLFTHFGRARLGRTVPANFAHGLEL